MSESTKTNYKPTLNLPKTGFPMRANLTQNEGQSRKRWEHMNLYESVLADRADDEPFTFHDGPPYANALLHVGHLLNKVLKDLVVRSQLMMSRNCPYVPGWDCHGLPIEHQVMTEMVGSGKAEKLASLSEDHRRMAIRRECAKYATKSQKLQAEQMKQMLTLADYDNPYLTMEPHYESAVLEVFARLVDQGLVYRALKSVHWSIANETALADAELEYEDKEDVSIYVDFEAADTDAVAAAFGVELDQTPSFMIWTTTPWTLPANLAIAVKPSFKYTLVAIDGNLTIIATELVTRVAEAAGAESVERIAETTGDKLVGLSYRHPFCDRSSPIVAAEYVTLEDGTGLVHTAPGHGVDDYLTGLREGFEIYCPVLADGVYDDSVPQWLRGVLIWDANPRIVEHLRESGHLFYDHKFVHSYPHDWRSKTPVIFRATDQWFIGVDRATARDGKSLRNLALEATDSEINFVPEWGRNRMRGMLESRPDWCLSRQRSWGLPIPAFEMPNGEMFLTAASVRVIANAFDERGSDAWFTETPAQLLAEYDAGDDPEAPDGFDVDALTKMYDIFDVWFESGSSWNAVMRARGFEVPVDLYLEGSDQHRGWFQLSLLPSLGATGQPAFATVLTHGFTVDKDGRKMSKSVGNTLDVDELLKKHGADVCRWWVSSVSFENDIRMDETFLDTSGETYRKVRNTLRFLLSNLNDFTPCTTDNPGGMCVAFDAMASTSIDGYILTELAKLQREVCAAYETYAFRKANQLLYSFCNDTLSAFYCAAVKDRLYCDKADSERRRRTQTVMWDVVDVLCKLLAPILPHSADEAYRALHGGDGAGIGGDQCVHMQRITPLELPFEADADWSTVLAARDEALKALEEAKASGIENPLDAEVVLPDVEGVLSRFEDDLADMFGVSRVSFVNEGEVAVNDLRDQPRCERCWRRTVDTSTRSDGGMLCDRCAEAVGV